MIISRAELDGDLEACVLTLGRNLYRIILVNARSGLQLAGDEMMKKIEFLRINKLQQLLLSRCEAIPHDSLFTYLKDF